MSPRSRPKPPHARLYLLTPLVEDPAAVAGLAEAMARADVAAVLLRLVDADERSLINLVKKIAPAVQDHDGALLIAGRDDIVARSGADGAHLGNLDALKDAVSRLKPKSIAGVGGLHTRHDAMEAGEAGADYVMFGDPDEAGHRPSFDAILDRVGWWAEVFEVPCVAYAAKLDEIDALASAGADFVALGEAVFDDPRGLEAALEEATARLGNPGSAP
jgi:thiamine-phosphate pyrophosphorylase